MLRKSFFHRGFAFLFITSMIISPGLVSLNAQQAATETEKQTTELQVWRGVLDTERMRIRIRFEVQQDGEAATGHLYSPDQANFKTRLSKGAISDGNVLFEIAKPAAKYKGELSADGKSVEGTWIQGDMEFPLNLTLGDALRIEDIPNEVWKGTLNAGVKLELQIRILEDAESKKEVCLLDSLTQGVAGLKATKTVENGEVTFEIPPIGGKFVAKFRDDGAKLAGIWSQGPIRLPLELVKTTEVTPPAEVNRPQHPEEPYAYRNEEVTFDSAEEGVTLAGTLTMPNANSKNETYMAAVLISGSGPQDRDESLMGHKPFLVIADHLTKQGMAVLRFDDRGTGDSTGDHDSATTADFANDVRGAVNFLRSRAEIDSTKVGLIGHSEGGLIGPIVTSTDENVAFLVMLAGPGVNGEKIILNQAPAISRASGETAEHVELLEEQLPQITTAIKEGADEERISTMVKEFAKQFEAIASEDGDDQKLSAEELATAMSGGFERMQTAWFQYFLTYEPVPALEKTKCPVLSIIGEKDLQVDPKINVEPITAALMRAGNPRSRSEELPGLNHLFQECETGSLDEYQTIEQTFSPGALKLISDWLLSL